MNIEQALQNTLGFGVKEFIEKAVGGGWDKPDFWFSGWAKEGLPVPRMIMFEALLDPKAWEAVGKAEGWSEDMDLCEQDITPRNHAKSNHYRFIDALYQSDSK